MGLCLPPEPAEDSVWWPCPPRPSAAAVPTAAQGLASLRPRQPDQQTDLDSHAEPAFPSEESRPEDSCRCQEQAYSPSPIEQRARGHCSPLLPAGTSRAHRRPLGHQRGAGGPSFSCCCQSWCSACCQYLVQDGPWSPSPGGPGGWEPGGEQCGAGVVFRPRGSQGEQSPGVRREYPVPATWALGLWDKHLNMIFNDNNQYGELSPGAARTFPTLSLAPEVAAGAGPHSWWRAVCGAPLILISPFCELEVALTSLMVTALRTGQWAKEGAWPVLRRLARRLPLVVAHFPRPAALVGPSRVPPASRRHGTAD